MADETAKPINAEHLRYIERTSSLIRDTLDEMQCQPIFFVGSGISKRYFGCPGWLELLNAIATRIGISADEFSYLMQKHDHAAIALGQELQERVFEWAWKSGKPQFPDTYFRTDVHRALFLKHMACEIISQRIPKDSAIKKLPLHEEISLLQATAPHAIITTNYDSFLESLFQGYEAIVGEKVIRYNLNMVGEIFKIHGSSNDPSTLVLTHDDYENYREKKKYISAKLLTYLAEHPVFILGYGFGDPNVTSIIEDVGEIIGEDDRFINNIFYVQWNESVHEQSSFREEYVIGSGTKQYRVRAIEANEFSWIFRAIAQERQIKAINVRTLRAVASRMYKLIRTDIPRRQFEVNYQTLEGLMSSDENLPNLLGIVPASNTNMSHPLVLTQVGQRLGYPSWHGARKLIERIHSEKGVNILSTDNRYHCAVKSGTGPHSNVRKYSTELVELLKLVKAGSPYTVTL
ncbi:SIR2 family protein [Rhodopseudomonas sp. P1]|uniref:SIR2 family protein n=1 Tax=Rhodopseudomonas sp. P1 TaxID=3434357 RepID=UPI0031FDD22F